MIGTTIDARPSFPRLVIPLVVLGCGLVALWAWSANPHLLIAAALPLVVALCIWLGQLPHLVLLVEQDGLRVIGQPEKVFFSDVTDVAIGGIPQESEIAQISKSVIEIHHTSGRLTVPPQMNVNAAEFGNFVWSRMPPRPARPIPAVLATYAEEQIAKFGPQRVHVVHARRSLVEGWRKRRRNFIFLGVLLAGLIWAASGIAAAFILPQRDEFTVWLVFGMLMSMCAAAAYFLANAAARNSSDAQVRRYPNACIIIGPAGLAMSQGDLQGAMPWHEVKKATYRATPWLRTSRTAGLQLQIRGAEIVALDIYDRPIAELEQLVRSNLNAPSVASP